MSTKCFHCKDDLWDDSDYEILEDLRMKIDSSKEENARLQEALKEQLNNSAMFHCPHYLTTDNGYVACKLNLPTTKDE